MRGPGNFFLRGKPEEEFILQGGINVQVSRGHTDKVGMKVVLQLVTLAPKGSQPAR